jgi:hypothetical protein
MPWFRHHYYCEGCDGTWMAQAAVMVEGDCPFCGARDVFAYRSEDWTLLVEQSGDKFAVLESLSSADRAPSYGRRKTFPNRAQAEAYLASRFGGKRRSAGA